MVKKEKRVPFEEDTLSKPGENIKHKESIITPVTTKKKSMPIVVTVTDHNKNNSGGTEIWLFPFCACAGSSYLQSLHFEGLFRQDESASSLHEPCNS